jgi:hypothetical protein
MGLELIFGLGALVLGLAIAMGLVANRKRNLRNKRIGDAATKEQYRHPGSYDPEKFRRGLEPEKR